MKGWIPLVVAAIVALGVGFGIGAAVFSGDDEDPGITGATETPEMTPEPEDEEATEVDRDTCLDALDELEQNVQAESRTSEILTRYEDVLQRSVDAIGNLDTRRLEDLLSEVEKLNDRSQDLIDDASSMDTSDAIDTCRNALGTT